MIELAVLNNASSASLRFPTPEENAQQHKPFLATLWLELYLGLTFIQLCDQGRRLDGATAFKIGPRQ